MMQSYRNLQVWAKSMDLVDMVYEATKTFPKDELYGLTSQIRRCAVSIPSNIAEGSQRNGRKEFLQFIAIAYGSLAELETQIEIASRQSYINTKQRDDIYQLTGEIGRMLNGLSRSIENPSSSSANRQLQTANLSE